MDPFTQRMLERARARQEKIDQKLANSGQTVPKRKPLSENVDIIRSQGSPGKTPSKIARESVTSPRKSLNNSPGRKSILKTDKLAQKCELVVASPPKPRSDVIVTKKEFRSPGKGSLTRRNSDVSVEINISHRNDIQIEVQVEERDAPISIIYDRGLELGNNVIIKEIEDDASKEDLEKESGETAECRTEKAGLRHNIKSRLDRLGNLYSDSPNLSSPIHRTEQEFTSATPPRACEQPRPRPQDSKKKFGRLAALADQINNWEDDLSHHTYNPEPKKPLIQRKDERHDASTLDVSIHSIRDINRVLQTTSPKSSKTSLKPINTGTFKKPTVNECQRLNKQIVAELEGEGYRRVSASQSRLVYDFTSAKNTDPDRQEPTGRAPSTPSAASAPNMATMVAASPAASAAAAPTSVTKKPSIKKYRAPTPPRKIVAVADDCDSDKDKENDVRCERDGDDGGDPTESCIQTKPADEKPAERCSPAVKRLISKSNGNADRNSVLSKAAMFESGSPRAKEKDPAEMSLRERKALFEKNKGAAIVPKAPFGLAPSVKTLHGDPKVDKARPAVQPTSARDKSNCASRTDSRTTSKDSLHDARASSKDSLHEDTVSQSSVGGGIKDKLAALFNREQTISETTIANRVKLEKDREMEMLQNRFHAKPKDTKVEQPNDSDDDQSEHDPSEKAPLMGSTSSLAQAARRPEIIANVPKVTFDEKRDAKDVRIDKETGTKRDKVVGSQPVKRRSSQDSPVVLSVVDDVKRIKVNNSNKESNGTVVQQPTSIYPHLSDIETDNSNTQEEYSDCGGSSTDNIPEALNKSDNWAETSFGREVMNVVKRNNSSYKKAVRESDSEDDDESEGGRSSELDDLLDEALESQRDGPTPPKLNKERSEFKSPLKAPRPAAVQSSPKRDRGSELVHSVSFYRRMQSASSTPSTPVRVVRHASPDREGAPTPEQPAQTVTTVRQRIKELQAELAKQQTIISQASQALNLCAATVEFSGSTEQAEGERLLLLATHRRQACLHEVQRLQVEGAGAAGAPGAASLAVRGLRAPLRRDYVRQLHADGAVGHHAVCLLKCRDRVLATSMQLTRPSAPLHFPDEIRMEGLASDFKVTVEVYLLQASKEILPHEVKYHINSKKSGSKLLLTPKSKAVSELRAPRVQSPAGPTAVRSPQFQLHGYCIFALQQAARTTFTLNKVPHGSPLEGTLNVDITAHVRVPPPAPHDAFLTAFDDVSGLGAWHRRWFRLQPPRLSYWKYPDDVNKKMPIGDIDLTTVVSERVSRAPRDLCARPNTLLFETSVPEGLVVPDSGSLVYARTARGVVRRHLLAADTPADRDAWLRALNAALEYVRCGGQ